MSLISDADPSKEYLNEQLARASEHGNRDRVIELIAAGADPNAADSGSWTPLLWSVWSGGSKCCPELIRAGADISATDSSGNTALHYAVWNGDTEGARVLLDAGADPAAANLNGTVPLHCAMRRGGSPTYKEFVEAGIRMIKMLIDAGADIYEKDLKGRTPMDEIAALYPDIYLKKHRIIEKYAEAAQSKRLKKEDRRRSARTGYEFDI